MSLLYVCHPLGRDQAREKNLERLERWFSWLLKKHPLDALAAPWYLYARVLPETEENRHRGIRDDLAWLAMSDGIVLCGPTLSEGMLEELMRYIKARSERGSKIYVYNYLGSVEPPEFHNE